MPGSEFELRADDGQSLLARRWLPEGRPRGGGADRPWPCRTFRPLRAPRRRAQRRRLWGLRQRPSRPRAEGRAGRPWPFRRRGRLGQGRRRPLGHEPPDRRRAAGRPDRLPRPFAGLVSRPGLRLRAIRTRWPAPSFPAPAASRRRSPRSGGSSRGRSGSGLASGARAGSSIRCGSAPTTSRSRPRAPPSTGFRATRRRSTPMSPIPIAAFRSPLSSRSTCSTRCRAAYARAPRGYPQGPADLCFLRRARSGRRQHQGPDRGPEGARASPGSPRASIRRRGTRP